MKNYLINYFEKQSTLLKNINTSDLINAVKLVLSTKKKRKKIFFIGNGGSAAIASHASVDFAKVGKIRCINFNEASFLTCFSNDYKYENWAAEAIKLYADQNDLAILISSSGRSKNIINAAITAKKMKCNVITFTGFAETNELKKLGKINFWVDSKKYNFIENTHQVWILSIIDCIGRK